MGTRYLRRAFTLYTVSTDIARRLCADDFGSSRRCSYCGRRMFPLGRVGIAFDGYGPAHLRCCARGRMPWRIP